jgi:pimeloyl-ACP methyl ester carboxylesterase
MRRLSIAVLWAAMAMVGASFPAGPASAALIWQDLPPTPSLPAPTAQGYVPHQGAKIFYRSFGSGPAVILLHGGLANGEYWGKQVPALQQAGYRVVVIDSRGHGRSTRDARPFTYELMASDVVAVMDALKLPRAAVVGWSDGAIVGLVMALHHPQRLTRVYAFAANMDPSGVKPDTLTNPTFARFERRAERDYARLSSTPGAFADFKAAIEKMWAVEPNYTAADLARIRTPVAIVDGDHDEAIKREHTEYLATSIPGARLVILPGASHFAILQRPAEFNAAMLAFLAGAGARPR